MKYLRNFLFCLVLMSNFVLQNSFAEENEEDDLYDLYGGEQMISIATGSEQPISKAPAVASVITAADIKSMGARYLNEVLETVPGLHVAFSPVGYNPIYTFRGIYTDINPQVLVLINGISINELFLGNRSQVWGGMQVEMISRIEIIRGPGSAVYGADAFAGVINIVLKNADDIDGTESGIRYGSFNTKEGWLFHGGEYAGFKVALMAEFLKTDGQDEDVDSDAQSVVLDPLFGTNASLAPGPTNNGRNNLDLRAEIQKGFWTLRGGLQRRDDGEVGFGLGSALDDNAEYKSDRWSADLTYHNPNFSEDWDVQTQVSYFNHSQEVIDDTRLFPPGAIIPDPRDPFFSPPLGPFTDGVIGNPEVWESRWNYNFNFLFTGIQDHAIRFGAGYIHSEIYRVREQKNFPPPDNPALELIDVSDTDFVFLPERHRDNKFGFVQDVWSLANDWELTAGIRYDDYNDFGDTWNPRAALVWSATHDTTVKFLYGQAFRAPSFAELYNQNNPVATGNPDLDPEEMETFEIAFDTRRFTGFHIGLNLFYYKWDDIIEFVPVSPTQNQAQNIGEQKGFGGEFEVEWYVSNNLLITSNYAYQHSEDQETKSDSGNAPRHQAYARADWEFLPLWHLTPQINYVGERGRPPGDPRSDLDAYTVVDLTLRRIALFDKWELAGGIRNLFNSSPEEPTDLNLNISNDLPLERRNGYVELRLRFE
ncbi:MAG: TonB-dependent receptor [Pseudomonadota bacterium]